MTPKQIDQKIERTLSAVHRIEQRIDWLLKKIEYRRRRIRELGKLLSDKLNFRLPLEDPGHHHDDFRVNRHDTTTST
jgi:hypothetical protein